MTYIVSRVVVILLLASFALGVIDAHHKHPDHIEVDPVHMVHLMRRASSQMHSVYEGFLAGDNPPQ